MKAKPMKLRELERADPDESLLNIAEAGVLLGGISVPTMRIWERQGRLASYRIGKRLFFKVRDLKAFIAAGRRPARSEDVAAR